jgi:alpha-tubulin suppressor-like RCC1 family protein
MKVRTAVVLLCAAVGAQACDSSITVNVPHDNPPPTTAPKIVSVAAGAHTCAISDVGAAYCWGYDASGPFGGTAAMAANPAPVSPTGGPAFRELSVSKLQAVTCGLTTTGAAFCWGDNAAGQIGDGTKTARLTPTAVAGGLTFKSIAVGSAHTCAVAVNGDAYCWGTSFNGALGNGFHGAQLTPSRAAPGLTFARVVAGGEVTCGLTNDGAAYCWGLNLIGQLGNGDVSVSASDTPLKVASTVPFTSLAAGNQTICGLAADGKAFCWGDGFFGAVGDGSAATEGSQTRHYKPTPVAGGVTFKSLSGGFNTTCGVATTGATYCWGANFGAIGDGTEDQRTTPTAVSGGLTFESVAAGSGFTCGVTTGSTLYCWGSNDNGQLGNGTTVRRTTPGEVRWLIPSY